MVHLREISVYFDDKRLVHLIKDGGDPRELTIPRGLKPTNNKELTTVKSLKLTRKWFIRHVLRSALTLVTLYSPRHYRGSHELGL